MKRLKPLRRRFIAVNMVTITCMLGLIFAVVISANIDHYRTVAFESLDNLLRLTNPVNQLTPSDDPGAERFQDAHRSTAPDDSPPPQSSRLSAEEQRAANALPGIVVAVDENENVSIIFSRNMDTSTATAKKIAALALDTGEREGHLDDYNLSYSIRQTPTQIKIAFVDRSYEASNISNLVLICLVVFIGAWLVFLLLVWRLSIWALRPVETAWTQQRRFIADASHELKTPLTVILANTRILKNHRQDTIDAQMRWLESTDQEALRIKYLVDSLLLLARNDANEDQPPAAERIHLSELVWSALLSFESVGLDHGLTFSESIADALFVNGDSSQLQTLVNILLDNACKYAPAGSTVTLSLRASDKQALLSVHNVCPPLSQDELSHLFDRFYRADASRNRATGGYGLGLAIAQSICMRHNGTIIAVNENDGLTFFVRLPLTVRHKK